MRLKVVAQLETLKECGIRHAILGAFGCGVFLNPPREVAEIYKEELAKRSDYFDRIVFAIYTPNSPNDSNFDAFNQVFSNVEAANNPLHSVENEILESSDLLVPVPSGDVSKNKGEDQSTSGMDSLLKKTIADIAQQYCQYTEKNCKYSLFHRHGASGRKRVNNWVLDTISKANGGDLKHQIITYLDNKKNGKTHAHSFRSLLINQLMSEYSINNLPNNASFAVKLEALRDKFSAAQEPGNAAFAISTNSQQRENKYMSIIE